MLRDFTDFEKQLKSYIFHELVHWCNACKFKRPGRHMAGELNTGWDNPLAAASCQVSCYGLESVVGLGGGLSGHGPVDMWTRRNCAVCTGG